MEGVYDYIKNYVEFQVVKAAAQAKLDMLLAESNAIIPSQEREKALELEVKIQAQRSYLGRIDKIVSDYGKTLAMIGQTFNKAEYEMFNVLIIRGVPPKNTKWALQTCYNFKSKVMNILKQFEIKEGN